VTAIGCALIALGLCVTAWLRAISTRLDALNATLREAYSLDEDVTS
jgi:hypothetical protein